jgi:transposase
LDVHQATISVAVLDSGSKLVMEAILETKAETILQFLHGLRGSLQVTLEEGTCAAWLHDLLKPHVTQVLVCDPRKNTPMKIGNKNDRIDARKLADLLYLNKLHPVYHGETGIRALKEVARSYLALNRDVTRVMNRLKAVYRSWAIPCAGQRVYAPRYRSQWLGKITEAAVRHRAEIYYQQLDALRSLRQQVRRDLLMESGKHDATKLLRQIPSIGPIRAALLIALMQTPHRFRTKRQLWAYCGLALKTSTSGEYQFVKGQLKRSKKLLAIRGLNANHNHDLKNIFKGAAIRAAAIPGPFQDFYTALLAKGMKPSMARLTLARAEIWPARRSGLSASAELLRVHADARCTRTTVRPHQALGYVTPIEFVERVKKSTQKIHKCP